MKIDSTNQGAGPDSLQLSKAAQEAGKTQAAEAAKAEKTAGAGKVADAAKTKAAAAGAGYGGDQVQLSNLSEALRAQNRVQDEDTPERAAYLEKLSRQVASGEYKPDASQIAKRMVDDLLGGI